MATTRVCHLGAGSFVSRPNHAAPALTSRYPGRQGVDLGFESPSDTRDPTTDSRWVSDAGRPGRSFAFAAANCSGVMVRLILSAIKVRTMARCKAGNVPSNAEAPRAYSVLAFVCRTVQSPTRPEAAASARSSDTRIPRCRR
jgi:hypothetical protein